VGLCTNGYTAAFGTATVGTGKAVAVGGLTLTGTAAGNYTLTQPTGLTANISSATVTITSGITANNKTYDGTTTATISSNNAVLSGVVAGDTANVALSTNGYTAVFSTAGVGTGKVVTVSGLTLSGTAAGNYTLTQPTGLSANISSATVTVTSGLTANNKTYDGTTTATISSNNVALAGVAGVDLGTIFISTNGYTATFTSAGIGTGIGVTISGLTLTGSAATNYALTQPAGLIANITPPSTSVALISSSLTNAHLASLSFTATVQSGGATATNAGGTVQFVTNNVNFGVAVELTSGAVTTNLATLPRGTNFVYAIYSGDATHAGSISGTLTEIISNNPPAATVLNLTRTAGLDLLIFWSDLTNSWSDVDGDPVNVSGINLVTTNGVTLRTNNVLILYSNTRNVSDQINYVINDGQGGTGAGVINISVNPFVSGQLGTTPLIVSGGIVSGSFYAIPRYTYEVQRSTNLVSGIGWVNVSTNVVGTNGVFSFSDAFSDLGGSIPISAYYRLGWHP